MWMTAFTFSEGWFYFIHSKLDCIWSTSFNCIIANSNDLLWGYSFCFRNPLPNCWIGFRILKSPPSIFESLSEKWNPLRPLLSGFPNFEIVFRLLKWASPTFECASQKSNCIRRLSNGFPNFEIRFRTFVLASQPETSPNGMLDATTSKWLL